VSALYDFMAGSPWLAFFLAWLVAWTIHITYAYCINRPLRHMNIRKHGWPPVHCDGDGDFRKEDEK
jgi:hypothetical protein